MAGAKFYYNLSDSLGEVAAKTASDSSKYTTPKDTFTIHNYYADADANYEYITPKTSTSDYGGWASYDYHAIAQDKFYYASSNNDYTSFEFVHKLSAPLLKKQTRTVAWTNYCAPFEYDYILLDNAYRAKIYWDNSNNSIKIDRLSLNGTIMYTSSKQGYGVFILLSGGGGGGGGGDQENLFQGKPGGGGGGGGGTALMYFDAKRAYDYSKNSYLLISIGAGSKGGKGGAGFTSGSAGADSFAELKNSNGATLRKIGCTGGGGGAGHVWNEAADSAGGAGGYATTSSDNDTCSSILWLLDWVSGGKGGAGKRGSNGNSGDSIGSSGNWRIPFKDSWGKLATFRDGSDATCWMGVGTSNNYEGGGGGGCGTGYSVSSSSLSWGGAGMGGYGGYCAQDGRDGDDGICCIFNNYIPGVTSNCNAKKV